MRLSMPLSNVDREKLLRLLAMFSSEYDGEVLNAARAAYRLLTRADETWGNVLANAAYKREPEYRTYKPHSPKPYTAPQHNSVVFECLEKKHFLTAWETEFLNNILYRDELSEKQQAHLNKIRAKLEKFKDVNW